MTTMRITGPRSLQSKLWRISDELKNDARRWEGLDDDDKVPLTLRRIAEKMVDLAKYLDPVQR